MTLLVNIVKFSYVNIENTLTFCWKNVRIFIFHFAPVICVSGPLRAGDTGDIAGLKCRDLTADESRQCRRCAVVLISR